MTDAWRRYAACRPYPTSWWFLTDLRDPCYHEAFAICGRCPVRRACLDAALVEESDLELRGVLGIRGGMNQTQRRQLIVGRRPVAS